MVLVLRMKASMTPAVLDKQDIDASPEHSEDDGQGRSRAIFSRRR